MKKREALSFIIRLAALGITSECMGRSDTAIPSAVVLDEEVAHVMSSTKANGMAVAVIDHGAVVFAHAFGIRNAQRDPLTADTVMYGASLTKTVFAYAVLQLVDEGKLNLDTSVADDLDRPLPTYGPDPVFPDKYGPYKDLADDARWKLITPRMCLNHSTGFSNFWFIEPDQKLRIHFDPGTRTSYSGEGFSLLQFVVEHGRKQQGLGVDVGELTQAIFHQFGMSRTNLIWHNGSDQNVADGWNDRGGVEPHSNRKKVRVAGSMNTTISDFSKFAAALVRGDGLSKKAYAELTNPVLPIRTKTQFPPFQPDLPLEKQHPGIYSGLGVVAFNGPQGTGFFKGGHDGGTANTLVCIPGSQRAVVILANDVRAEAGFAELVQFILGDTGVPYDWEYGDHAGKS